MTRPLTILLALALGAVAVFTGFSLLTSHEQAKPSPQRWHCPMHPQIVSDKPGSCPICGMNLVPVAVPGSDGKAATATSAEQKDGVSGQGAVHIDARRRQMIGVVTAPVQRKRLERFTRAVGRVTYDETRKRHVHTKIDGYVERLFANTTGQLIRRGQPLLEIYSPELLASQQEFLVALAARDRLEGATASSSSLSNYGQDLVASARRRLQLFDLTPDQITRLESTRAPQRTVTVYAPESGVVTDRMVTEGQRIEAGMTLLDLVDLSRVWVLAAVYEYELPFVHLGQRATMRLSYLPGQTFTGSVSLVYPSIDATTRTAQVRIELDNPGLLLKPDMYAETELTADLGERVAVPEAAILETGTRSLAFVEHEPGVFEPREVRLGARMAAEYEVLSGLAPGEQVVVSGNFLIDSESKLKAALQATEGRGEPADPHAGHVR